MEERSMTLFVPSNVQVQPGGDPSMEVHVWAATEVIAKENK